MLIPTSTERSEVLDKGGVVIGGVESRQIHQSIVLARGTMEKETSPQLPSDYKDMNISVKVVKIIQSYTKIINKYIWNKPVA